MIKVAPLIHTRTYKCDFNPNFLVCPENFTPEDIAWARKIVLTATADIDSLKGERWVIAKEDKLFIVGAVCITKNLVNSSSLNEDKKKETEKYFRDEKGRNIYDFIGYSIETDDENNLPDITLDNLLQEFRKYIPVAWEKPDSDIVSIKSSYEKPDLTVKAQSTPLPYEGKNINGIVFYDSESEKDRELFVYYLSRALKENIKFCSNISSFRNIKKIINGGNIFTALTTAEANITRLEMEERQKAADKEDKIIVDSPDIRTSNKAQESSDGSMKSCLVIFSIIIALILFIVNTIKKLIT